MKHFLASLAGLLLLVHVSLAQTYSLKGRITDSGTNDGLPGATIQIKGAEVNTGTATDFDGNYEIPNLKPGTYEVIASYIGYTNQIRQVVISNQNINASFKLSGDASTLKEIEVVADVAIERQTPVAFAQIREATLRESLSNRDLPLILNETPGVYATQGGGGSGDSEISIRGFKQENVAVMVNGVPVNDMETGAVYWSNWDLGDVTKTIQVQRGLTASKLAVPSVGGLINIITKGFDAKRGGRARQEIGSNGYWKSSLMLSSGELKGGWAVTVYGARRKSDGWVQGTFDDAYSYFGTVSKRTGKHTLSLTAVGSPQKHGQRSFASTINMYSHEKAREFGADTSNAQRGFDYNRHWGILNRFEVNGNDTIHKKEFLNERQNYYHKPQFNLNHFWDVSDKIFVSNVVYASFGNGGGIGSANSAGSSTLRLDRNGQTDFQYYYNQNYSRIDRKIDSVESKSNNILRSSVNNHRWIGFISSVDYKVNDKLTASAGIDGRDYVGYHYQKVYDLLGGDYTTDYRDNRGNKNANPNRKLREGDKIAYDYDGKTRWLGGFGMLEFKNNLWTAFVSGTYSYVGYKRIDYFKSKVVEVGDTTFNVGYADTISYNGQTYTNADAKYVETDWVRLPGFSLKAGANYNLSEFNNIFFNVGYISKAPLFKFVFDNNTGTELKDVLNEKVFSVELGYGINLNSFKATLNAYNTYWFDRSSSSLGMFDGEQVFNNIRNIDARHTGVELNIAQEISKKLELNAAIMIGDWRWSSIGELRQVKEDNTETESSGPINLEDVHVGGSAQNQFMFGLRFEPVPRLYIRPTFLLFSKFYADFNPEEAVGEDRTPDSYRLPTSRNLDVHYGYSFKFSKNNRLTLNGSVLNVLNEFFITNVPARNGVSANNPSRMEVFFNRGRTYTMGLTLDF